MYLPSASPNATWQARRGFSGLAGRGTYRLRRYLYGLGQNEGDTIFDVGTLPLDTSSIDTTSLQTLPNPFQTLPSGSLTMPAPLAPTTTNYPTITPPAISSTSSPIASLFSTPTAPSVAAPAQPSFISAISAALGLTKAVTGAATRPAAPAGYAYNAAGQLVPVSSSLTSSGGTLLLLGGGAFLLFAMMGARK